MGIVEDFGLDALNICRNVFHLEGEVIFSDLRILCPNPKHDDHEPSCYVLLKEKREGSRILPAGTWSCFSCKAKGDILSLGKFVLRKKRSEIRAMLEPGNANAQLAVLSSHLESFLRPPHASLSAAEAEDDYRARNWLEKDARSLESYEDGPHDYLMRRGFSTKTIKKWGFRYVGAAYVNTKKGRALIKRSLAIPVRDVNGSLAFWIYRRSDQSPEWQPKYLYTLGAPRSSVWIGEYWHWDRQEIVLCEGGLDAAWLDQAGIGALGIGGSGVNVARARTLAHYDRVILFMDRDDAGQWATQQIGAALWEKVPVYIARYRKNWEGTDPQSLDASQVRYAVEHAVSWPSWTLKQALEMV